MGILGRKPKIDRLVATIHDAVDPHARAEAFQALGESGDPRAFDELVNLLNEAWLVGPAAVALAAQNKKAAIRPLAQAMTLQEDRALEEALASLSRSFRQEVLDAVLPLLHGRVTLESGKTVISSLSAIRCLGMIGGADLVPHLEPFLSDPSITTSSAAAGALDKIGGAEAEAALRRAGLGRL